MEIYTIGFTQKSAAEFFGALKANGIQRLVDVRLNNVSQLSGYSKRDDLQFFLRSILDAGYVHEPSLAPEAETLKAYRDHQIDSPEYERRYLALLESRHVETTLRARPLRIPHRSSLQRAHPGPVSSPAGSRISGPQMGGRPRHPTVIHLYGDAQAGGLRRTTKCEARPVDKKIPDEAQDNPPARSVCPTPESPLESNSCDTAPWCSGLTCHPVTVEIVGSNPIGVAINTNKPPIIEAASSYLSRLA